MRNKWNITKAKQVFKEHGYKLVTTKYINVSTPMVVKNPEGYVGKISLNNFLRGKSFKVFKTNYSNYILRHNIHLAMVQNQICTKILNIFVKNDRVWVRFQCSNCQKEHEKTVWKFLQSPYCPQCGYNLGQKFSKDTVEKFFNDHNYKILNNNYYNNISPLFVEDKEGYYGFLSYCNLSQGLGFKPFRSLGVADWIIEHNLKNYFKLNNITWISILALKRKKGRLYIKTVCPNCGRIFWRILDDILQHPYQQFCKSCRKGRSELELHTAQFLQELNIQFEEEFVFENTKYRYDFYLPDYNLCIETDDPYHFNKNNCYVQQRDKAKDELCKKLNVKLLRIPYWEFPDNYKKIIIKTLK